MDELQLQHDRVTMDDMLSSLRVPMAKFAAKQIVQFNESRKVVRPRLQMDATRKQIQS